MSVSSFQTLEDAVLCFYQSNNPKRDEAQKLLTELQNSPEIWRIIWEQMLMSKFPEIQFYGATTLHAKLLNDWEQIPIDQYDILKSKLFETILYFKDGSKIVQNRLCIALATLMLRMMPAKWPNPISDVISTFQPQNVPNIPEHELAVVVLDILCVIPEQYQTMWLSKNEKIFVKGAMTVESSTVLSLLENTLFSDNTDVIGQSIKCAKSWLEFGLPIENCSNLLDVFINIILATYDKEEVSKFSVSALEAISIIFNHTCNEKYENTLISYIRTVLKLSHLLIKDNEAMDPEFIPCLCTLYVEIGDSQMKLLLNSLQTDNRDITLEILKIILHCSDAPGDYPVDEVYSLHTFNFWYQLQDDIITNYSDNASVLQIIKPLYKLLVPILLKKSAYPENIDEWSKQNQDNFRCYRQDIADTCMYCYALVEDDLVNTLLNGLTYAVYDKQTIATRWRQIEAHMYAFLSIADKLVTSPNENVDKFLSIVYSLPFSTMNRRVSLTAMEIIGGYAEWYRENPEHLGAALNLVLEGISNKQMSSLASVALKEISRECQPVIISYASETISVCEKILEKKHLDHSEEARVLFAIGKILSIMPSETMFQHLKIVVPYYIDNINAILTSPGGVSKNKLVHCINVFTQLFLSLETQTEPNPTYYLLETLLPIYKEVLKHDEPKIQSAVCVSLRCAVNNVGESCAQLIPAIIEIIVMAYRKNTETHFLDVAKQVLIFFGNNQSLMALLSQMIRELCAIALEKLSTSTDGSISDHPVHIEHFYLFSTNLIKKNSTLFIDTPGIDVISMFRFASLGLCLQETSTVKAVASFLANIITISREINSFSSIVQAHGAELVHQIIIAIAKSSPRPCLELVSDVLIALNKKYCDWLSRWLNEILAPDNFPSPRATAATKKRFIKTVLRERGNRRKVLEVTREFAFICRGLMNKDYIQETTSRFF